MIWNPSEGIHLGFINIRFYSLMFVIAFGLGWYIMKNIFINEKQTLDKLDTLFIWTVLATLLGARLGHVFFYDWEYFSHCHYYYRLFLQQKHHKKTDALGIGSCGNSSGLRGSICKDWKLF